MSRPSVPIRVEAWAEAKKEAQRDGLFAGLTSGFTSALIGSRLMGFNRNTTIICGVVTGALSGYFFTQAFLSSNISRLRAQEDLLTSGNLRDDQS